MFDVITFGSATKDIFVRSEKIKIIDSNEFLSGKALGVGAGEKITVEELIMSSGGGATNAAATFALQEFKTAYVGLVGHDLAGREIIRDLQQLGVFCDFIKITKKAPTPVAIILTVPGGERSILVYLGASHLLSTEDIPWKKIKETKWIYLTSLAGKAAEIFEPIINFASENKIKIAVNPGRDQFVKNAEVFKLLLPKIDVLLVNQEEASIITGIDFKNEKKLFSVLDELTPGLAVMTKGNSGVAVSDGKILYTAGIPKSDYVERTGAGDAFCSGFVSAIMRDEGIEQAIQLGTANATSCVQKLGAKNGLLRKGEKGEWAKVKVTRSIILKHNK